MGSEDKAVELFRRRAALGGDQQEVFYSLYQAGALLGPRDAAEGIPLLLAAWQQEPTRAEPLHELARISRFQNWPEAALMFAARGLELRFPEDRLLVHRWIYEWGLHYELAVSLFDTGRSELAARVAEPLLDLPDLPADIADYLRSRLHQARMAPRADQALALEALVPDARFAEIRLDVATVWQRLTPTIASYQDGYVVIVHAATYRIEEGRCIYLTEEPTARSQNYRLTLSSELEVHDAAPWVDSSSGSLDGASDRYEECRLLSVGDALFGIATVRKRDGQPRELALLKLDPAGVAEEWILALPDSGWHERSWTAYVVDDAIHCLISGDPAIVLRVDPNSHRVELVCEWPSPSAARPWECGSQGVRVEGGFLFVVHETAHTGSAIGSQHRLILLGEDHRLAGMSPPFHFVSDGAELCAGLALRNKQLLMAFAASDGSGMLAVVGMERALSTLQPVDQNPDDHGSSDARSG